MKKISLYFAIGLVMCVNFCSCTNAPVDSDSNSNVLWVPLNHHSRTEFVHFDSLFESIDTIQLQQVGEESMLGAISDIKTFNDTLLLCSNNSLFLFNSDGSFIRKINRRGRGRGEYLKIEHFDINKNDREISILDVDSRKIVVYSINGDFIRQINLPEIVFDFSVTKGGDYLCYCPKYYGRGNRGLWQIDSLGNYKKHLVEIDDDFRYTYSLSHYLVNISEDEIGLMGSEDFDNFYHINSDSIYTSYTMKTDIKIPGRYKRTNNYPDNSSKAYVKCEYYETKDLLFFILNNVSDNVYVFYDKRNNKLSRYYVEDLLSIQRPEDIIPRICSSDNGKIFYYYDAGSIINNEYLQYLFPSVNEHSNPVLFVCNSFR